MKRKCVFSFVQFALLGWSVFCQASYLDTYAADNGVSYNDYGPPAYDYAADYNYRYASGQALAPPQAWEQGYTYPAGDLYDAYDGRQTQVDSRRQRLSIRQEQAAKSYSPPKKHYVPVIVKKKEKKQKILSITKGSLVTGGTQVFGKFKDLKSCMKACSSTPTCFAGDYNPWLGKCYFHGNSTACSTMTSHPKITHFKKIPCTVTDAPQGKIILGSNLFGGIEQKGAKSLSDCLKKCVKVGGGIAPSAVALSTAALFDHNQLCFGIDYDFSTHKCYLHTVLFTRPANALPLCPVAADTAVATPIDLQPSPSSIHILLCPT